MQQEANNIQLKSIHIYPVKSLAGYSLEVTQVEKQGLQGDRLWMLVDDKGVFISQRDYPKLALLKPKRVQDNLVIRQASGETICIRPDDFSLSQQSYQVWQDQVFAKQAKPDINQFFSDYLNQSVRLIQYDPSQPRATDYNYSKPGDIVSFADGFPLLLLNQASLDDLNQRLDKPVSMQHFRGNLIIEGAKAFAEDHWKRIRIGDIEFDLVKPCSRCVMTCVDPQSGIMASDTEPLRTLAKYRKQATGILFGINIIPRTFGLLESDSKMEIIA